MILCIMPHRTQKQEQLFPRAWAAEVNAVVIFSTQLHPSTLLQCLNSRQLYFFCPFLICRNSLCYRILSYIIFFLAPESCLGFFVCLFFLNSFLFNFFLFSFFVFPAQLLLVP